MMGMKKAKRGTNPVGAFKYVLKGGDIIGGNMSGTTRHELSAEFLAVSQSRPDIMKMCWHQSLRLPKGEALTNEEWVKLADKYMRKMGFSDSHQRIYVMHNDRKGQHIHIVANRVGLDGKVYLGKNENLLSSKLCRELEKEFGLTQIKEDPTKIKRSAISHGEKGKGERLDEIPITIRLQHSIDTAAKGKPAFAVFVERLEAQGVSVLPNGKTGECSGVSFAIDGEARSGTDLGHSYKFVQLTKRLDFDKLRDQPVIDELRKKAAADREEIKGDISPAVATETALKPYSGPRRTLDLAFKASDDGVYVWKKSNTPALVDHGTHISVMSKSESAIRASLQLAKQKGWASVKATGNAEFQRKSWLIAQDMGLEVQGYTPTEADKEELKQRLKLKQGRFNGQNSGYAQDVGRPREPSLNNSGAGGINQRDGADANRANDGPRVTDSVSKNRAVPDSTVVAKDRRSDQSSSGDHENNTRQTSKSKAGSDRARSADAPDAGRNAGVRVGLRRVSVVRGEVANIVTRYSHRAERLSDIESNKRAESALRTKQRADARKVGTERARRIESVQNGDGTYQSEACKLAKSQEQNNKVVDWSAVDHEVAKIMLIDLHTNDQVKTALRAASPVFADSNESADKAIDSIISDLSTDNDVISAREAQKALEAAEVAKKATKKTQDQDRGMRM
ncbi:MAG: relaxase/mobilization nuclease domain-containing protein [Methylobacter sp.]